MLRGEYEQIPLPGYAEAFKILEEIIASLSYQSQNVGAEAVPPLFSLLPDR